MSRYFRSLRVVPRAVAVFFGCIAACGLLSAAEPAVSLESLLDEMVDRSVVAQWPQVEYTCRQASSYDRGSVSADQPGWFANWDRSHFVRIDEKDGQKEYVLMDAEGPGAVVRFWATWHGPNRTEFSNGTLRFYLDGQEKPAIEGPLEEIIDRAGLVQGCLSQGVSPETEYKRRGHNLYLPIPYANGCKVTYSTDVPVDVGGKEGEALYYQINYRTYAEGTTVDSFRMEQLEKLQPKIDAVQERLTTSGSAVVGDATTPGAQGKLAPGDTQSVNLQGPAAINQLSLRLTADNLPQALRSTILEIQFDGRPTVWCPVGDFFGIGYRMNPCRTWYTQVTPEGLMSCYWVMPFRSSAQITLHNLGTQTVAFDSGNIRTTDWDWNASSMHFHSTWRQYTKVDTGSRKTQEQRDGVRDVNYVTVDGQGVYVGDTLTLFNGAGGWWGEGDEKIYVDGEDFPSHFGTGTEDYYGYAWCRPESFAAPFHSQPDGSGNLKGGFAVNSRYRSLDAIPFTESLRFDMELWHWFNTKMNYAPATFWYAKPGAKSNVAPDPATAKEEVVLKREQIIEVRHVKDAIEAETLKVIEKTGGETKIQFLPKFRWSNDRQLWWINGKPGDSLVVELPVEKAGRYKVTAGLVKAGDYAIVKLRVNDAPAGEYDLYDQRVVPAPAELGVFDLGPDSNRLTIEITGANPAAGRGHRVGLDYVLVEPVE